MLISPSDWPWGFFAGGELLVSWREVPLPFFRTQAQIILGLLVLAALDQSRASGMAGLFWTIVMAAILAYASSVGWGLGLPGLSVWASAICALLLFFWLSCVSRGPDGLLVFLNAASRAASGFLLGATLSAMLLGHYYLTAPAMTIEPLKRTIGLIAGGLAARAVLAGIGWASIEAGAISQVSSTNDPNVLALFFGRWGMGFLAAGIATYMTWKTAQIRSSQSATGILYITMIFVSFGELSSLVLSGRYGVIC